MRRDGDVVTWRSIRTPAVALAAGASVVLWIGSSQHTVAQGPATVASVPMPTFHHLHINSVDPERSLKWYEHYWPEGERTTLAGFPAFHHDGFYLLYTQVSAQAPGGFDRSLERSVPQSAFWTFGSTFEGADSSAFRERIGHLPPEQFAYVPLYGGPGGAHTAPNSFGLPMGGQLLTLAQLEEQAGPDANGVPRTPQGQDFGYFVDPDGMLAEFAFIAGAAANSGNHSHLWHEQPLCAANWYVDHLGMQLPPVRDLDTNQLVPQPRRDPCEVPVSDVITYPAYTRNGQLREPRGAVAFANGSWIWYARQCRYGRCEPGHDEPLSGSRGQVVDHVGLTYPDLDTVLAHLAATGVQILEGPYRFGDTRAVLIEDLDGLALELIEANR